LGGGDLTSFSETIFQGFLRKNADFPRLELVQTSNNLYGKAPTTLEQPKTKKKDRKRKITKTTFQELSSPGKCHKKIQWFPSFPGLVRTHKNGEILLFEPLTPMRLRSKQGRQIPKITL